MAKKIIKLTESQLVNKLQPINSGDYNSVMSLNEMAQINVKEMGVDKKQNFNCNSYYVYVKGEGGYKKFPHFHIRSIGEGWDIRMNMDGSFNSIKTKSDRRQIDEDFADIEKIAKNWVTQNNVMNSKVTNGELAQILWNSMN